MKKDERLLLIEYIDALEKLNLHESQVIEKEAIGYCIKALKDLLN